MNKENEIIDAEFSEVEETEDTETAKQTNSTLEIGNYVIEVVSEGQVIRKLAIANSEINIQRIASGGMTIDLK